MSDSLSLSVEVELVYDPDRREGNSLFMCHPPATVMDGDVKSGSVSVTLGAGVLFHDAKSGKRWHVPVESLWAAFQKALPEEGGK